MKRYNGSDDRLLDRLIADGKSYGLGK